LILFGLIDCLFVWDHPNFLTVLQLN